MARRSNLNYFIAACCLVVVMNVNPIAAQRVGSKTVADTLHNHGFKLFHDVMKIARSAEGAQDPKIRYTVLAPTDQAIRAFLKKMGLTVAELAKRPQLAHDILTYHLVPYIRLHTADVKKPFSVAATADTEYTVQILKGKSGQVSFKDTQGNVAKVVQPNLDAGFSIVHGIDRVLLSGDVFTTPMAALKFYSPVFSNVTSLINRSPALARPMAQSRFSGTIFAPINTAAFAFGIIPEERSKLPSVLSYHVAPGFKPYPLGFKQGKQFGTMLKGHNLMVNVTRQPATTPPKTQKPVDFTFHGKVIPEASLPAEIGIPNIWAGQGVIHGILSALMPTMHMTVTPGPNGTMVDLVKRRPGGGRRLMLHGSESLAVPTGFKGRGLMVLQEGRGLGIMDGGKNGDYGLGGAWAARVDSRYKPQLEGADDGCCLNCQSTVNLCKPSK